MSEHIDPQWARSVTVDDCCGVFLLVLVGRDAPLSKLKRRQIGLLSVILFVFVHQHRPLFVGKIVNFLSSIFVFFCRYKHDLMSSTFGI